MHAQSLVAPTPWKALLWKEFHQVRPAFLAVVAGMFLVQCVALVVGLLSPANNELGVAEQTMILALVAPALVAMACSGMMIGHERQTGTWSWSSSLPVPWLRTLLSKIVVSLALCLFSLLPLAVIPIACSLTISGIRPTGEASMIYASPVTLIIAFEVIVFFSITTLVFREALNGMVVGAVVIIVIQLLLIGIATPLIAKWTGNVSPSFGTTENLLLCAQMLLVLLFGFFVLCAVYRWRWGIGQLSNLNPFHGASTLLASESAAAIPRTGLRRGVPPSEFRSLLSHSMRSAFGIRVGVIAGLLLSTGWLWANDGNMPELLTILIGLAAILLGVTTFAGDQAEGRYRFLADRGATPRRLVTARLLPPSLIVVSATILSIVSIVFMTPHELRIQSLGYVPFFVVYISCFVFGVLSSLCFSKTVVSLTAAIGAMGCGVAVYSVTYETFPFRADPFPYWFPLYLVLVWCVFAVPFAVYSIYRAARNWLVTAEPRLARAYFSTVLISTFAPLVVTIIVGFLGIPKVDWKGLPISEFKSSSIVATPLPQLQPVFPTLKLSLPVSGPNYKGFHDLILRAVDKKFPTDAIESPDRDIVTKLPKPAIIESVVLEIDARYKLLSDTMDRPAEQADFSAYVRRLNSLLQETAILTLFLTRYERYQEAKQALECNHALQKIALEKAVLETAQARFVVLKLWQELLVTQSQSWEGAPKQLEKIAPIDELRELMLPKVNEDIAMAQAENAFRESASRSLASLRHEHLPAAASPPRDVYRYNSHSLATTLLPPLRWRRERAIAFSLSAALDAIQNHQRTKYYLPDSTNYNISIQLVAPIRTWFARQLDEIESKVVSDDDIE